ncbi:hypothetical protein ACH5RR_021369 [Cinchona calisaya]|uniref:RBR-type E3 ubiquitin transferase n=1 Tax=Cinchona calisaya TaxID=153742 RepID=A0ABD2ZH43_9GENT
MDDYCDQEVANVGSDEENYEDDSLVGSDEENYEDSLVGSDEENYEDDSHIYQDEISIHNCNETNIFTILKVDDIRKRLDDDIAKVSSVLFVSRGAATILLCKNNWDADKVNEEWFADEEKVRKDLGLIVEDCTSMAADDDKEEFFCGICLENYSYVDNAVGVDGCGHLFCRTCLGTYVSISINDGRGCLMMRCPQPKCGAAVGRELVYSLASDEDKKKYDDYLIRSYIEDRTKTKWCPAPGCEYAVDCVVGSSNNTGRNFDVTCNCSYEFCWNCLEEAHSPVNCEITAKWIEKNSSESENTTWILTYTKPCPKCKKPIEKNQGCMHMTCKPPCRFQFCWLCLGPWSEHGKNSGGYYSCNTYDNAKRSGVYNEDERKKEMAKKSLVKYTHYYERWASNSSSQKKAAEDLQKMQNVNIVKLTEIQGKPGTELEFIIEAWLQIMECRRVLKWTYAYGYYLSEDRTAKKQLFECMQGEAEAALERLHQCAEVEIQKYLEAEALLPGLISLTSIGVTGSLLL